MNKQSKLGISSLVIAAVSALALAPASIIGMIVAIVGMVSRDQDGRRRFNWRCSLGLVANSAVLIFVAPYVLTAFGL